MAASVLGSFITALAVASGLTAIAAPAVAPGRVVEEKSIADLQSDLAAGRITSEGLVGAYLARIEAIHRSRRCPLCDVVKSPQRRLPAALMIGVGRPCENNSRSRNINRVEPSPNSGEGRHPRSPLAILLYHTALAALIGAFSQHLMSRSVHRQSRMEGE